MSNVFKKAIAVTLCVVMTLGMAPLGALSEIKLPDWLNPTVSAVETLRNTDLVYGSGGTITRVEWLHDLSVIFDMTVESDNVPDNYFFDITPDSPYYKDVMLTTEFGVIDIPAGGNVEPEENATREFAVHTLNYCLRFPNETETYSFSDASTTEYPDDAQVAIGRGWVSLIGGKFMPEQTVTTSEIRAMIEDAQAVVESTKIDESIEDEFVFDSSVKTVTEDTEVDYDGETLFIYDSPIAIAAGDQFTVAPYGVPALFRAVSVEKQGSDYAIKVEAGDSSLIGDITASGSIDGDLSSFVPAEGVVVLDDDGEPLPAKGPRRVKGNKKIAKKSFSKDIPLGKDVSANISVKLSDIKIDYQVRVGYYYLHIDCDADVTFGAKFNLLKDEVMRDGILLGEFPILGIGTFEVWVKYSLSGNVSYTATYHISGGFQRDGQFRPLINFTKKSWTVVAEIDASAYVEVIAGVDILGKIVATATFDAGIKARIVFHRYDTGTPQTCLDMAAWLFVNFRIHAKVPLIKAYDYSDTIYDENNSPVRIAAHVEDGIEVPVCSRTGKKPYTTPATSRYGYYGGRSRSSSGVSASGEPYTIFTYSLDKENNATITGYNGNVSALIIPETLDGYPVVAIGNSAFRNKTALRSVVIPDSVVSIGAGAFARCTTLSNVQLSKNLNKMGAIAFGGCTYLSLIEIPKSLESCGANSSSSTYGEGPFDGCTGLKQVRFEEGVTRVASNLFNACGGLETIVIPNTVTSINSCAFNMCSSLRSVTIGAAVTEIGTSAFRKCALTNVTIPDSVTKIGASAFSTCAKLENVRLSRSLKTLGSRAFYACQSLSSIEIPKSLESCGANSSSNAYGEGPFDGCTGLKQVCFEEGVTRVASNLFNACSGPETIVIPDTVTSVNSCAFNMCGSLRSVTIGAAVTEIGNSAFRQCALTNVTIPDSVTTIGASAFSSCVKLESVRLSRRLKTLGSRAFYACKSLSSIEIPKSLESCGANSSSSTYGEGPFDGCTGLKQVCFEEGATKVPSNLFNACSGPETIVIPDTVISVNACAFNMCGSLRSVTIGAGVTTIENYAFHQCVNLADITVPANVNKVGTYAFASCSSLKSAEILNDDATVGAHMFDACGSLETVRLPANMKTITDSLFKSCTSLKAFNMPQNITRIEQFAFNNCDALESIEIPDMVQTVDAYAFYDDDTLKTVTMVDTVTSLGSYAFQSCDALEIVTLSKGLLSIPQSCFADCTALREIEIPHNLYTGVTSIGKEAFRNCTGLSKVVIPVTVTSIGAGAFSYPEKTVIYGCKGSYAETYANNGGFVFVDVTKHIAGIALKDNDAETVVVTRGYTVVPEFDYLPADTTDVLTLKSNNTSIATIKNVNQIYGNANGTATVTATTSGGLDYTFNVLVHTLNSIALTPPAKLTYNYGEALDTTGMTVTATYSDGTSEPVNNYTVSGYNPETYGTQTVKVTYLGKSATFTVEVLDTRVKLTGIAVTTLPDKTAYEKGEAFDPTGIVVTGTYSDGSTAPVTGYAISAMNSLKVGTQTLTVTYEGFTDTFTVTVGVAAPTLTDITVKTMPAKTTYTIGESFDQTGLTLTATYSDGSTKTVTGGFTCSGFSSTTAGTKTVTVTYEGKTTSFTVTVVPPHEHSYTSAVTKEPTCQAEGVRTYTCACGDSYTEPIAKVAHSAKEIRINPTCTTVGSVYTVCVFCGEPMSGVTELPATGHTTQEITEAPTCMADGRQFTKCSVCGETFGDVTVLPKIAHSFGAWVTVKEATTEEEGLQERACIYGCGTKETQTLPKIKVTTVADEQTGITLTYPENAFEGEVDLTVQQVFDGTAFNLVDLNSEKNAVFDIKMMQNGTAVQPNGKVTVRIPVPAGFDPAKCMVYHVSTETGKLEKIPARYENGFMAFETDHFSYYAIMIAKTPQPTVAIKNYAANKTVDYRSTITFTAEVKNPVDGAKTHWFIDGKDVGTGETYTVKEAKKDFTVQAKYMQGAKILAESETETVKVNSGFFAKLKAFFRALFGKLPVVVQEYLGVEYIDRVLP